VYIRNYTNRRFANHLVILANQIDDIEAAQEKENIH
jgi:hypothetical protein